MRGLVKAKQGSLRRHLPKAQHHADLIDIKLQPGSVLWAAALGNDTCRPTAHSRLGRSSSRLGFACFPHHRPQQKYLCILVA